MDEIVFSRYQVGLFIAITFLWFFLSIIVTVTAIRISNAYRDIREEKNKEKVIPVIDNYTMTFYLSQLTKMVEIYVTNRVEALVGERISTGFTKRQIENETVIKEIKDVQVEIRKDISDTMWNYLTSYLSEEYLRKYIRDYVIHIFAKYVEMVEYDINEIIE